MNQTSVLVVENDPTLCETLCDTLEMAGYAVQTASEGQAALSVLERHTIGMVVSDVQMRLWMGIS